MVRVTVVEGREGADWAAGVGTGQVVGVMAEEGMGWVAHRVTGWIPGAGPGLALQAQAQAGRH